MKFSTYLLNERNIANVYVIDKVIDDTIKNIRAHRCSATRLKQITNWIKTTYKKWIINKSPNVERIKNWNNSPTSEWGPEPEWFQKAIKRGDIIKV